MGLNSYSRIPPIGWPSLDPRKRSKYAVKGRSPDLDSTREVKVLRTLTEGGCSSTPRLLASKWTTQDMDIMPVPGGYICFVCS
jgi:hypothetical protein